MFRPALPRTRSVGLSRWRRLLQLASAVCLGLTSSERATGAEPDNTNQWLVGHSVAALTVPALATLTAESETARHAYLFGAGPALIPVGILAPDLHYDGSFRRPWTHTRHDLAILSMIGVGLSPGLMSGKHGVEKQELPLLLVASGTYLAAASVGFWQLSSHDNREMSSSSASVSGIGMATLSVAGTAAVFADIARRRDFQYGHVVLLPLIASPLVTALALDSAYQAGTPKGAQALLIAGYGGAAGYLAMTLPFWALGTAMEESGKRTSTVDRRLPNWIIMPSLGLLAVGMGTAFWEIGSLPSRAKLHPERSTGSNLAPATQNLDWQIAPYPGGMMVSGTF